MKITLNEIDIDSLAPLTRRPNNYDDYQISFYWVKSVLAMLATATQGTVLSYSSIVAFDEDVVKAVRSELHALAWMSLAAVGDEIAKPVESVRLEYVMKKLEAPMTIEGHFPEEFRKGYVSAQCTRDLYDYAQSLMVDITTDYALFPMLRKAVIEMTQYQNYFTVYPVLRGQIMVLLSQRVAFLQKQGL